MAAWFPYQFPFIIPERADAPAANRGAVVTWEQIHKWSFRVRTWDVTVLNSSSDDPLVINGVANYNFLPGFDDGGVDMTHSYMPNEKWNDLSGQRWQTAFVTNEAGVRMGDESSYGFLSWNGGDRSAPYGETNGFFKVGTDYYFVPAKFAIPNDFNYDTSAVTIDGVTITGDGSTSDEVYVSATIVPASFWPYDPGDGNGPCFDFETGEPLRDDIFELRNRLA